MSAPNTFRLVSLTSALLLLVLNVRPTFAFDQDGLSDYVIQNVGLDDTQAVLMQQVRWFSQSNYLVQANQLKLNPTGTTCCWHVVAVADFNRDGHPDLLWREFNTGQNALWLLDATTNVIAASFIPNSSTFIDPSWYIAGVADFDGDGYPDIVWRQSASNTTAVWYMNQGGTNTTNNALIPYYYGGGDWILRCVGDFNNDGYGDLLWQNEVLRTMVIWHLRNTTLIDGPAISTYPSSANWTNITTGIYNSVGNTDLIFQNPNLSSAVLWWMRDTAFGTSFFMPPPPSGYNIVGSGGYTNRMLLSATASTSPASLKLDWRFGETTLPSIQRRTLGSSDWGVPLVSNYAPTHYTNTDLTVGQRYEYLLGGTNYLLTAIAATPDSLQITSGKQVALIVDSTRASAIAAELSSFKSNLVGDGWSVVQTNVPRHDDVVWANNPPVIASIKQYLRDTYAANPNTKAAILIGHVPVPYAGSLNPDFHGNRALPADGYYADFDGVYHDSQTCENSDFELRNQNEPNDGKWDEGTYPGQLKMAVGRIDFAKMDGAFYPLTEVDLLKRYFVKDDRYRQGLTLASNRVVAGSFFDWGNNTNYYPKLLEEAVRNGSRIFGSGVSNLVHGDCLYPGNSCVWGVIGGAGQSDQIGGSNKVVHTTQDFVDPSKEPQTLFISTYGSYLMDFEYTNFVLKAFLGMTNYGLGVTWFSPLQWPTNPRKLLQFEQLGLGETIGSAIVRSINYDPDGAQGGNIYMNLLGDPTLRWQIVRPASSLSGGNGTTVTLNWTASQDTSSYFVYRSLNGLQGPWINLTTSGVVTGTSYTDSPAPSGVKTYQVRAAKLTLTGSGSFTNLSQGVFYNTSY